MKMTCEKLKELGLDKLLSIGVEGENGKRCIGVATSEKEAYRTMVRYYELCFGLDNFKIKGSTDKNHRYFVCYYDDNEGKEYEETVEFMTIKVNYPIT